MRTTASRLFKPPLGTQLERASALTRGLVWFAPLWEAAGNGIGDVAAGTNLTTIPGTPWGSGAMGGGLNCNTNGYGAAAIISSALQLPVPITIMVGVQCKGAPSNTVPFLGLFQTENTNSRALSFEYVSSVASLSFQWNGTSTNVEYVWSPVTGTNYVLAVTATSSTVVFYINGIAVSTQSASPAAGSYSGTPQLTLGSGNTFYSGRNINMLFYWGGLWNRALAASEVGQLGSPNSIWQIFAPPLPVASWATAPSGASSYWRGGSVLRPSERRLPPAIQMELCG
jgi:hypothetical protein